MKQIIILILIIGLMNGCMVKRVLKGGGKGHSSMHR